MRHPRFDSVVHIALCLSCATVCWGAPPQSPTPSTTATAGTRPSTSAPDYVLGPDDVIAIKALDVDEINTPSIRIDPSGEISLTLIGRLTAAGRTVEGLEKELATRLKKYVHEPVVTVTVVEYSSQPVTVIGMVGQSGVHQLEGRKSLVEILAAAGGLRPEAGNIIKITRRAEWGRIPLASAVMDPAGQYSVAEVNMAGIIQATSPEDNILILPNDVISVPKGDLIYVIGEVRKPGGFVLQDQRSISGLRALAMAEGFSDTAAPQRAIIIRQSENDERIEIAANLRDILNGKKPDVQLLPDDILFVPNSAARSALGRTIQTAISALTSASIYRVY